MTVSLRKILFVSVACAATCYAAVIGTSDFGANVAKGLRLIETAEGVAPKWVTPEEKLALLKKGDNFVSTHSFLRLYTSTEVK